MSRQPSNTRSREKIRKSSIEKMLESHGYEYDEVPSAKIYYLAKDGPLKNPIRIPIGLPQEIPIHIFQRNYAHLDLRKFKPNFDDFLKAYKLADKD